MVFSMATNQNMKAFALSPRVTPLVFFLHYFLFFLYLTPFVAAYDKVQKSQLQEELSLWFQHLDVTRTLVTFLHSREERGKEKIKGKFHSYVDIASPVVLDLHMSGGRSQFGQAI